MQTNITDDTQQEIDKYKAMGYLHVRRLPDGTYGGLSKLLYTTAICLNLDYHGYGNRFCFNDPLQALNELNRLKDCDEIPEGWVARR